MSGREPGEPHGEKVFPETQDPVAEGLGYGVDGGARRSFRTVGGEGHAAGEKGGYPAPLRRNRGRGTVPDQRRRGGTYEGMHRVPDGIDVGNFVGEKLDDVKSDGDSEHQGVRDDFQRGRKMNDAEALQKAERSNGCIEIEAGGKTGAKGEAQGFKRVHG